MRLYARRPFLAANFRELRLAELPGMPLLSTSANKDKNKGRSCHAPAP